MKIKENAVSEAISIMLMISIAVAAFGILTATFVTQVSIEKIPQADLVITKNTQNELIILSERGEPLSYSYIQIKINEEDKKNKFSIKRYGENMVRIWENYFLDGKIVPFSPGDALFLNENLNPGTNRITVTYNLSSGSTILYDVYLE